VAGAVEPLSAVQMSGTWDRTGFGFTPVEMFLTTVAIRIEDCIDDFRG